MTLQSTSAPCTNDCGCIGEQPDHYTAVVAECPACLDGSPRLPPCKRKQAEGEYRRLEAEELKFRSELNHENEPEEKFLCSIPAESLMPQQARRLQALRGNLEKVLKYYLGPNDNLDGRRDRLDHALSEFPERILESFSNECLLDQVELLQEAASRWKGSDDYMGYLCESYAINILKETGYMFGLPEEDMARAKALGYELRVK